MLKQIVAVSLSLLSTAVDAEGRIVYRHFGEGGYAENEAHIKQVLAAR